MRVTNLMMTNGMLSSIMANKADMNKKKPSKEEIARKMYQQFIDALQD